MKKIIIILVTLTLIMLMVFILVSYKTEPVTFKYNNTYSKTTNTYINDNLYSTNTETIILLNGILNYESNIIYNDSSIEPIKITYIDKYIEKQDRIITDTKTYYLNGKKICLETLYCDKPYTINKISVDNKITEYDSNNHLKYSNNYKELNNNEIYIFINKTLTKKQTNYITQLTKDLNIKINIIKINKKNKQEINNLYNINKYPSAILYKNNESILITNINTYNDLILYLYLKGIDYR